MLRLKSINIFLDIVHSVRGLFSAIASPSTDLKTGFTRCLRLVAKFKGVRRVLPLKPESVSGIQINYVIHT